MPLQGERLNLFDTKLEFFRPDQEKFPCLTLAYEAIRRGGNMPCILNAANEVVNLAFRQGRCSFYQMSDIIGRTMQQTAFDSHPDYDVYMQTDTEARAVAEGLLQQ